MNQDGGSGHRDGLFRQDLLPGGVLLSHGHHPDLLVLLEVPAVLPVGDVPGDALFCGNKVGSRGESRAASGPPGPPQPPPALPSLGLKDRYMVSCQKGTRGCPLCSTDWALRLSFSSLGANSRLRARRVRWMSWPISGLSTS